MAVAAAAYALSGEVYEDNQLSMASFSSTLTTERDFDDLKRAALEERYAPLLAARKAVLVQEGNEFKLIQLEKLKPKDREILANRLLPEGRHSVEIVQKIAERIERAGMDLSQTHVRFRNLTINGKVGVGGGGLPTFHQDLINKGKNILRPLIGGVDKFRDMKILDGVSGALKPGRFTLLLGPPGSGKSMLMRALAGQLRAEKTVKLTYDELTYSGSGFDDFVIERSAGYISQLDIHNPELTVRETLDFSARCQGMKTRMGLLDQIEQREKELGITPDPEIVTYMTAMNKTGKYNFVTEVFIRLLGLENCADTIVGNAMLRGISGGQKKRVTSGEVMVGPMRVLYADEISTGLDSATTFDICESLRDICHAVKFTMVIALLQPSPETYDLFDDIMLLSSGCIVYHGPREGVLPFFQSTGFVCPERKGIADFLQEVTSPTDQKQYWALESPYCPVDSHQFSAAFYKTPDGQAMLNCLATPVDPKDNPHLSKDQYGQTVRFLLRANLSNQFTLMNRNMAFNVIHLLQFVFMAFCVGTLFLQEPKETINDANLFMGVAFFSVMYCLTSSFPDAAVLIQRLPVFYKQRDAHFYPAFCWALPQVVLRAPWSFAECWIWTLMVYFMVGFYTGPQLLAFWGVLFASAMFSRTLFLAIGCIARTQSVATAMQSFCILVFISTSGFTLVSTDIPDGWIGAYYANPLAYFIKAVLVNEMTSPDWDTVQANGMTLGENALANRGFPSEYKFVWIAIFAWGVGASVVNIGIMVLALTYLSAIRGTTIVSEEFLAERSGHPPVTACKLDIDDPSRKGSAAESTKLDIEQGGNGHVASGASKKNGAGSEGDQGLSFKRLCLTFKDVRYSVPIPKEDAGAPVYTQEGPHAGQLMLLKGITGCFRPGVLTALMGASGAGKTTLMDVLAGRKTGGTITGEVLLNGFPKDPKTFARIIGYVEQTDIHVPETTVHEALIFSAQLRLPSNTPSNVLNSFVDEMEALVELNSIRDSPVGLPGGAGLSVEQRKRLTIAVELVANPSIVFMDEPTSGLDARAAAIVMRTVRNTVNTGRTVVCTIHQPSLEIFEAFDELLLLKRGGETIFHGPIGQDAANLIGYLSALPHVPPIKPRYNPAGWMLEVTSPDAEATTGVNFSQQYRESEQAKSVEALVDSHAKPPEGDAPLRYEDLHVAGAGRQLAVLLGRNFRQYTRALAYNGTRVIITIVISICFGTLFIDKGGKTDTFNDVFNITGALYMSVLFLGVMDCLMVLDLISTRRSVYYREHAAGMYHSVTYSLAELLVELPYIAVQSMVASLIIYWIVGFEANAGKFFFFFLGFYLSLVYWCFFGIQNVHITPAIQLANAFSALFFGVFNLFCGYLKPQPQIGSGWIWAHYADPFTWSLYSLIVGQLGDMDDKLITNQNGMVVTIPQFLEDYFGYKNSMKGWTILILVAYVLFFGFNATLALNRLNFMRR